MKDNVIQFRHPLLKIHTKRKNRLPALVFSFLEDFNTHIRW